MKNKMDSYLRCVHGLMDSKEQQNEEITKIYNELHAEYLRLMDFKEFTNMIIRRTLNHNISNYQAIIFIDEKLTKETPCTND